jgi:hypothetical protein
MDKIVPYLIPYKPIISLKLFDQDKASFLLNQILFSLKFILNQKWHCSCGPANGNGLAAAARPDPPFRPMPHARWMTTPTIPFPVSTPPRDRAYPCTPESSLSQFPGAGTLPPRRISSKARCRPPPPVRASLSPSTLDWLHPSSSSILP